jgi:hypothetical protein
MPAELPLDKILAPNQETATVTEKKEMGIENKFEVIPDKIEQEPARVSGKEKPRTVFPQPTSQSWQLRRAQEIDDILAEGLNDIFLKMNSQEQAAFKKAGEETVAKINVLLSETKVKVNKIVDLIKKWLKMIPGVNKFFLEQEVKIKTDKIIKIKNNF